ncbi:MAG TPA: putative sulfate exporter family transporter [Limnobacter sp.]|uniref:YeiH family protein n=1 Tax=Limnobacter sp. TaxID=2003368 RepID=UPI002E372560|nr:putative sulfate exporter family transporter [Limnobacter sp.]HEX5485359.1 putative sulfate exporter family transporter [Limnobacter sp.]
MRAIDLRLPATLPGLALCIAITAVAWVLANPLQVSHIGLGWMPLALVLAMLVSNSGFYKAAQFAPGVSLSRGNILRWGIALFAIKLELGDIMQAGVAGIAAAGVMVFSTIALARFLGKRLGLPDELSLLIGTGSGICGAAAVAAADGVLRAESKNCATGVAVAVLFGTLGMFVMPLITQALAMQATDAGLWIGLSVHELGHVIGASEMVGPAATNPALLEKMLRVAFLAPALMWLGKLRPTPRQGTAAKSSVLSQTPLFMWGFVLVAALKLMHVLPTPVVHVTSELCELLLAIGLCALGLNTRFSELRTVSVRAWGLAILLWGHLLLTGLLMVQVIKFGAALH